MSRRMVTVTVVSVLFASNLTVGQEARTQDLDSAAYVKLLLVGHPIGSVIDVILVQKGSRKITGKLVAVSENSLEVEQVRSGKLARQQIAFSDVKNVMKHGMSNKTKALIAVGVAAAVVAAVVGLLAATGPFIGGG